MEHLNKDGVSRVLPSAQVKNRVDWNCTFCHKSVKGYPFVRWDKSHVIHKGCLVAHTKEVENGKTQTR